MLPFPQLRQLIGTTNLQKFSSQYEAQSGLPIPDDYLLNKSNQVFGFYLKGELAGGFILGHSPKLRTIALFSQPDKQPGVYNALNANQSYTEICCLWMSHAFRKNAWSNTISWLSMALAINRHAHPGLVFGTCSGGLARLYKTSQEVALIHQDRINRRNTYIFCGEKRKCFVGIGNIVLAKLRKRIPRVGRFFKVSPL